MIKGEVVDLAQVNDKVALKLLNGATVILTPQESLSLAKSLKAAAEECLRPKDGIYEIKSHHTFVPRFLRVKNGDILDEEGSPLTPEDFTIGTRIGDIP